MNSHFQRGHVLLQQERYEQAATEFQQALAQEPDNAYFHAMLATALLRRGHWQNALQSAQTSVAKEPGLALAHWTLATVHIERGELREAERALERAIEIDPEDADYHGLKARVLFERNQTQAALAAAECGLAIDPKNDLCLSFRSRALTRLGRHEEARQDADTLLSDSPDDAWNHCLQGDQQLELGDAAKAREHYIEALRLDPRNENARAGLALSLKARSPFYSVLLVALLHSSRYSARAMWIAIIVFFVGLRIGDSWATQHPEWLVVYEVIKALIWAALMLLVVANPVFDLLLRFDKEGRLALTDDEVKASNWHLACFGLATLCGIWALTAKTGRLPATIGFSALFLTRAVSEVFEATPGYVRRRMAALTIGAAVLLVLTPVLLIAAVVILASTKRSEFVQLIRLGLFIPSLVMLYTAFVENIRAYFEKRRPDLF